MQRYALITLSICVFASPLALASLSAQSRNCNDCAPARKDYSNPSGTYRVVFSAEFDSNQKSNALTGIADYWGALFAAADIGVNFDTSNPDTDFDSGQIKFVVDENVIDIGPPSSKTTVTTECGGKSNSLRDIPAVSAVA